VRTLKATTAGNKQSYPVCQQVHALDKGADLLRLDPHAEPVQQGLLGVGLALAAGLLHLLAPPYQAPPQGIPAPQHAPRRRIPVFGLGNTMRTTGGSPLRAPDRWQREAESGGQGVIGQAGLV